MIKGFLSQLKLFTSTDSAGTKHENEKQVYATLSQSGVKKYGLDVAPRYLGVVATLQSLDATGHTKSILSITGHSIQQYDWLRFTSGAAGIVNAEVQVVKIIDANTVLIHTELPVVPAGSESFTHLRSVSPTTDLAGNLFITSAIKQTVDTLDTPLEVPTGARAIPRSSVNALQIVASTAALITEIQMIHDMGEPTNLYLDAARTQFVCHLPLTPDEKVTVSIPAGSALFIGAAKDVDIDDATSFYEMNFIG